MRKTHSTEFKSKLVLEVLCGERPLVEIASENNIHPNMLTRRKTDAVNHFGLLFDKPIKTDSLVKEKEVEIEELYKQIGKLSAQIEWLKKNLVLQFSLQERRAMVDYSCIQYPLSLQAELLSLHRSGLYYKPVIPSEQNCQLRQLIDWIYMQHPEFGHRRIAVCLNQWYQIPVDRRTVLHHMQDMGIQAIYPHQNTSRANPENKVYPYLLKNIEIDHPNHVWSIDYSDIKVIPIFLYIA